MKDGIGVVEVNESSDIKKAVYPDEIHHGLDTMIALQLPRIPCTDKEGIEAGLVDVLFKEGVSVCYYMTSSICGQDKPNPVMHA